MKRKLLILILAFYAGKFTYAHADGIGVFVPHVGGYHINLIK